MHAKQYLLQFQTALLDSDISEDIELNYDQIGEVFIATVAGPEPKKQCNVTLVGETFFFEDIGPPRFWGHASANDVKEQIEVAGEWLALQ